MDQVRAQIEQCQEDIQRLLQQLDKERNGSRGQCTVNTSKSADEIKALQAHNIEARRNLAGHYGKVYAVDWCQRENRRHHLVSASQDGKLIVWDTLIQSKLVIVPLQSSWVMTVAMSPNGEMLACGGLDNSVSTYRCDIDAVDKAAEQDPVHRLPFHEGYLSCCAFAGKDRLLSASGDTTVMLMDLNTQKAVQQFWSHESDVMSVIVEDGDNPNVFVTGSCDCTAKVWDLRENKRPCVQTHFKHVEDVNAVSWFPDQRSFATASDDGMCHLFDIRSWGAIQTYSIERCGFSSCGFSSSGRLFFSGADDFDCQVWDSVTGELMAPLLEAHELRVTCLRMATDGNAFASGSWDTTVKIWA